MSVAYNLELLLERLMKTLDVVDAAIGSFGDLCATAERAIIKDMEEPAE